MDHTDTATSQNGAGTLAARLRNARVSKGYGLEDLAVATGLAETEISAIEDGTSAQVHHATRIEHSLS